MGWLFRKLKKKIYHNIIKPVIESVAPVREAALGSAIGMFVGMTPTVGIQMWIVFMIWIFCKYLLKIKFDLIIGTALVWLSNPITMVPLYYGFLITGYKFFAVIGVEKTLVTYQSFSQRLDTIVNMPDAGKMDIILEAGKYLIVDLGYPMVLGSLFWAIPLAITSYWLTRKLLYLYRKKNAIRLGISYQEWRAKFERK
jgi:uncharacterized protein